jgi:hypothetical protein
VELNLLDNRIDQYFRMGRLKETAQENHE